MEASLQTDAATVREMLNADEVLDMIHISRSTLFRLERDGLFPKGLTISPNRKLWFKDTVVAWQRDLQDPDSEASQAVRVREGVIRKRRQRRPI